MLAELEAGVLLPSPCAKCRQALLLLLLGIGARPPRAEPPAWLPALNQGRFPSAPGEIMLTFILLFERFASR